MPTYKDLVRQLGYGVIGSGFSILQNGYSDLKPAIFDVGKIKNTFVQYGFPNVPTGEADYEYAFLTPEVLEPILWDVMTLLHKTKYKLNMTDCDDFAYTLTALMSMLFGINTCGTILGRADNKNTGAPIGGHYFNFPITYKNGLFEMWCCDALNPLTITKIEKGKPIIINDWKYVVTDTSSARYF